MSKIITNVIISSEGGRCVSWRGGFWVLGVLLGGAGCRGSTYWMCRRGFGVSIPVLGPADRNAVMSQLLGGRGSSGKKHKDFGQIPHGQIKMNWWIFNTYM